MGRPQGLPIFKGVKKVINKLKKSYSFYACSSRISLRADIDAECERTTLVPVHFVFVSTSYAFSHGG